MDISVLQSCCDLLIAKTEGDIPAKTGIISTLSEDEQRKCLTGFAFHAALTIFDQFNEAQYSVKHIPPFLVNIYNEYVSDDDFATFKAKMIKLHRDMVVLGLKDCPCCDYAPRAYYVESLDAINAL